MFDGCKAVEAMKLGAVTQILQKVCNCLVKSAAFTGDFPLNSLESSVSTGSAMIQQPCNRRG